MRRRRTGCGLLLGSCVITCVLLVVNRVLVTSIYAALVPPEIDPPKLRTALAFLAIVALLFPEWWWIDWCGHHIRRFYGSLESPPGKSPD
jgi:hypothetical protein